MADDRVYHECMQLTSQFKFCPMAFRVDMSEGATLVVSIALLI